MRFALLLFAFILSARPAPAQAPDDILALFDIRQTDKTVLVTLGVRGGFSCQGVRLERWAGGPQEFLQVDYYPGLCGGTNETEFYTLEDAAPVAGAVAHYRLELGNVGTSKPKEFLFVSVDEAGIALWPVPAADVLNVRLLEAGQGLYLVRIVDAGGRVRTEGQFRGNEVRIDLPGLPAGVYILSLTDETGRERRRNFVVR